MDSETARKAIFIKLKEIWLPEFGPVSWPNVDFATPKNQRWAEIFLVDLDTQRVTLGRDYLKRAWTSLQINLYCPRGIGSKENLVASYYLENTFDTLDLVTSEGLITFETPRSHNPSGAQERQDGTNDNWFRRIVDCPFYYDTQVTK